MQMTRTAGREEPGPSDSPLCPSPGEQGGLLAGSSVWAPAQLSTDTIPKHGPHDGRKETPSYVTYGTYHFYRSYRKFL